MEMPLNKNRGSNNGDVSSQKTNEDFNKKKPRLGDSDLKKGRSKKDEIKEVINKEGPSVKP